MPHEGSAAATALKPLMASGNQNECWSATARSNCGCTAGLQDAGNFGQRSCRIRRVMQYKGHYRRIELARRNRQRLQVSLSKVDVRQLAEPRTRGRQHVGLAPLDVDVEEVDDVEPVEGLGQRD